MDNIILGRDYNVCLTLIHPPEHMIKKSRQSLLEIMAELNLSDAWVNYSKQADHYTCTWEQNNTKNRLDYFLMSVNASYNVS